MSLLRSLILVSVCQFLVVQNTHVSNMDVHVVAAIDGFTSIYSNLNSEQSLEFLNWVKENVNGEVTLLSTCIIYIDLDYKSQRKRI